MKDTYLRTSIGENIRRLRLERKMTQNELADKAGISRTSINNVEAYRQSNTTEVIYALADALQVSVYEILPPSQYTEGQNYDVIKVLRHRLSLVKELAESIVEEC